MERSLITQVPSAQPTEKFLSVASNAGGGILNRVVNPFTVGQSQPFPAPMEDSRGGAIQPRVYVPEALSVT